MYILNTYFNSITCISSFQLLHNTDTHIHASF